MRQKKKTCSTSKCIIYESKIKKKTNPSRCKNNNIYMGPESQKKNYHNESKPKETERPYRFKNKNEKRINLVYFHEVVDI